MDSFSINIVTFPATVEESPVRVPAQDVGAQSQIQTIRERKLSRGGVGTTYHVAV